MNKEEKKALWSFLSIYVISSTIFMIIIAYMYFDKEIKMVKMNYKMNLGQEALQIKADILETHMKNKKYTFKSKNDKYQYGILSQNDKFIYSNLKYPDEINLNKEYVVTEKKTNI